MSAPWSSFDEESKGWRSRVLLHFSSSSSSFDWLSVASLHDAFFYALYMHKTAKIPCPLSRRETVEDELRTTNSSTNVGSKFQPFFLASCILLSISKIWVTHTQVLWYFLLNPSFLGSQNMTWNIFRTRAFNPFTFFRNPFFSCTSPWLREGKLFHPKGKIDYDKGIEKRKRNEKAKGEKKK